MQSVEMFMILRRYNQIYVADNLREYCCVMYRKFEAVFLLVFSWFCFLKMCVCFSEYMILVSVFNLPSL